MVHAPLMLDVFSEIGWTVSSALFSAIKERLAKLMARKLSLKLGIMLPSTII
jgi:hypothetical protein